jgi:hypothetical protein
VLVRSSRTSVGCDSAGRMLPDDAHAAAVNALGTPNDVRATGVGVV